MVVSCVYYSNKLKFYIFILAFANDKRLKGIILAFCIKYTSNFEFEFNIVAPKKSIPWKSYIEQQ